MQKEEHNYFLIKRNTAKISIESWKESISIEVDGVEVSLK